jgi:two-component system sensor histidine kinase EvgS
LKRLQGAAVALVMLASALGTQGIAATRAETTRVASTVAAAPGAKATPIELTAEERAWLAAHPVVRVGAAQLRNQIEVLQHDGRYGGISGDLLALVASRLGITLDPRAYRTLPERLDALDAGALDIVPALTRTHERERRFRLTRPYMDAPVVYVARRGSGRVVLPNNLKNLRIAVDEGGAAHERLLEAGLGAQLLVVATREEALRAVADGRADTHIGTLPQIAYALERELLSNVEVRGRITTRDQEFVIAASRQFPLLVSALNKGIATLTPAEVEEVWARWVAPSGKTVEDAPAPLTNEERSALARLDPIRVGYAADAAPYSFADGFGSMEGLAGDVLRAIVAKTGAAIVSAQAMPWPQLQRGQQDGSVHLVTFVGEHPGSDASVRVVGPWHESPVALLTRTDANAILGLNQIGNRRVAVTRDSGLAHLLQPLVPAAELLVVDTAQQALEEVATGGAYAFATALPTASYLLAGKRGASLRIAYVPRELTLRRYFAVRADSADLALVLERGLKGIAPAEHLAMQSKWAALRPSEEIDWRQVWRRLWLPVLGLFALLAIALAWAHTLKREIALRHCAEAELRHAKERAERMAQVKEEFLAVATHEIRAPVNAISGAVNRLAQLVREPDARELVQITRRSVDALTEFVNNVLDLSKSEAGKLTLNPQPDDLCALFREIEAAFGPLASERGNTLSLRLGEIPPCLCFDSMRVRQIVVNLLSNALKFTEDGQVTIDVRAQPGATPETTVITIVVVDNGIGITPDQQKRLFEPYTQLASGSAARFGGTGLGLSICKRLTETMGGAIEVASVWQEGTVVTVRLPLALVEGAAAQDRAPRFAETVLIVDDDPVQQVILTAAMRQLGLDPDVAEHGREALERWQERRHAVVITDCNMPKMNGYELARALRATAGDTVRVIGMSADADDAAAGIDAGMDAVLQKPISTEQLRRALLTQAA